MSRSQYMPCSEKRLTGTNALMTRPAAVRSAPSSNTSPRPPPAGWHGGPCDARSAVQRSPFRRWYSRRSVARTFAHAIVESSRTIVAGSATRRSTPRTAGGMVRAAAPGRQPHERAEQRHDQRQQSRGSVAPDGERVRRRRASGLDQVRQEEHEHAGSQPHHGGDADPGAASAPPLEHRVVLLAAREAYEQRDLRAAPGRGRTGPRKPHIAARAAPNPKWTTRNQYAPAPRIGPEASAAATVRTPTRTRSVLPSATGTRRKIRGVTTPSSEPAERRDAGRPEHPAPKVDPAGEFRPEERHANRAADQWCQAEDQEPMLRPVAAPSGEIQDEVRDRDGRQADRREEQPRRGGMSGQRRCRVLRRAQPLG